MKEGGRAGLVFWIILFSLFIYQADTECDVKSCSLYHFRVSRKFRKKGTTNFLKINKSVLVSFWTKSSCYLFGGFVFFLVWVLVKSFMRFFFFYRLRVICP